MNSNRKADLQRKLSMAPVPAPPAGLATKIKNDIPDLTQQRPGRRARVVGMGIAASLLLVAGSAYFTMSFWSPARMKSAPAMVERTSESYEIPERTSRSASGSSAVLDAAPAPPPRSLEPGLFAAGSARRQNASVAQAANEERDSQTSLAEGRETDRTGRSDEATTANAGFAPVIAAAEPAAAPAAPPPPSAATSRQVFAAAAPPPPMPTEASRAVAEAVAERTEDFAQRVEPSSVARAKPETISRETAGVTGAAKMSAAPAAPPRSVSRPRGLFGVPPGDEAFVRVKDAIERGERPRSVSVEGLVNYFAGPGSTRRRVSLDVEASPGATTASPLLLRISIDARKSPSELLLARDARLSVEFDRSAVDSHRRVGGAIPAEGESLRTNDSVTMIYEVRLADAIGPRARVATVRLRYENAETGKAEEETSALYANEIVPRWQLASPRHRRASLGAMWGETLRADSGSADVAVRAEELSSEDPKDGRARDLARLATAFSRLRSSSPTGSGL